MKAEAAKWFVGQTVYKLVVERGGKERHVKGVVKNYCPMSTTFLVLYSDGSVDGVPLEDIDDYVPIALQLKMSRKKRKNGVGTKQESVPPEKRRKMAVSEEDPTMPLPALAGVAKLGFRIALDFLWALTVTCDTGSIADSKRKALSKVLSDGGNKPRTAIARYFDAGGLGVMRESLSKWTRGADGSRGEEEDDRLDAAGRAFVLRMLAGLNYQDGNALSKQTKVAKELEAALQQHSYYAANGEKDYLPALARWMLDEHKVMDASAKLGADEGDTRTEQDAKSQESRPTTTKAQHCSPPALRNNARCCESTPEVAATKPKSEVYRRAPYATYTKSRCNQHLRELLTGAVHCPGHRRLGGSCSAKPNQRNHHAKTKEARVKDVSGVKTPKTPTPKPTRPMKPAVIDVSSDDTMDEEIDSNRAYRRIRFGVASTLYYEKGESPQDFRLKVLQFERAKRINAPRQNPEVKKSALKSSCVG